MSSSETESSYGYCPECGHECKERERRPDGNDICINGHTYPTADAVSEKDAQVIRVLIRLCANDGKLIDQLIDRLGEKPEDWVD